jgi:hypothetical protein
MTVAFLRRPRNDGDVTVESDVFKFDIVDRFSPFYCVRR